MTHAPVYLDHAATTPVDARVVAAMAQVLTAGLGNPASTHPPGRAAATRVARAREQVAALIGAAAGDIVFTSGATEANALAILGHVRGQPADRRRTGHVVALATDHKAILGPVQRLADEGLAVTRLVPDRDGVLSPAALAAALRPGTLLVSLVHVNSETGVAQDLAALSAVCRERGVALHVDAAQSAGKLPLSVEDIDYLSLTAHKFGGPQGVGALYVAPARRVTLQPQQVGGGQERGLRAGTLPTHQIVGMGLACELALAGRGALAGHLEALRQRLWQGLADLPGVLPNGHARQRAPGILNLSFEEVEGESLLAGLPELAVATGSACNSSSGEPSYVLRALGRDTQLAQASLRLSLGATSTEQDVDTAIAALRRELARLRALSPRLPPPVADWQDRGWRVLQGEAGERRLGTWVRLLLAVQGDRVVEARFQAYGCPHTLAACQALVAALVGQGAAPQVGTPAEWLTQSGAPADKLGRMLLLEDALQAALAAW
jgi:cysteine desulfurase